MAREGKLGTVAIRTILRHLLRFGDHVVEAVPFAWRGLRPYGSAPSRRHLGGVVLGLVLAAPIVTVLGLLLVSADSVFASLFFGSDFLVDLPMHLILVGLGAMVVLGLFRSASVNQHREVAPGSSLAGPKQWLSSGRSACCSRCSRSLRLWAPWRCRTGHRRRPSHQTLGPVRFLPGCSGWPGSPWPFS